MNIPVVIKTLKELSNWLDCSKSNQEKLYEIIDELEDPELTEFRLQQLKFELSTKMSFHPKCFGDIYVPGFIGDGTPNAWINYLAHVADICQNNLS